jgi:hypothetical protein
MRQAGVSSLVKHEAGWLLVGGFRTTPIAEMPEGSGGGSLTLSDARGYPSSRHSPNRPSRVAGGY